MYLGENSVVKHGAVIRGPVAVGNNTVIGSQAYIGPYTSIGNNVTIEQGEIENSIVMDNCKIAFDGRITDSLIGPFSRIVSNQKDKPSGYRFVIGARSKIIT